MISSGRTAAIAIVALGMGFVGGAWFISSGYGYSLLPVPTPPPPPASPGRAKAFRKAPGPSAVGLPRPAHSYSGSGGLMPVAERTDLLPSPGCDWEVEPRPFQSGHSWHKTNPDRALGGYSSIDPANGGLRYLLVQSTRNGGAELDLRPVFFDGAANRMVPRRRAAGSSRGPDGVFVMTDFQFEPFQMVEPSKAAYFAIERVVPDAAKLLVEAAQEEAEDKGVAILPEPRLGQPYPFDIADVDGKPVRSADLKGKAVVVTIWGPGGFGNLGLMFAKKLRESYKADEVAFVSVSFDGSAEEAKQSFAKQGTDGPLVVLPNDPTTRRLWVDGSRIDQIPKFFLVDREGVLNSLCQAHDLKDRVDILFGRAVRPPFNKPRTALPKGAATNPPAPPARTGPSPKAP